MAIGTTAAIIGAAVLGAGTSFYQADEQKRAAEGQQRRVDAEAQRQKLEAERISRETRPEGQTVGGAIKFGTMSDDPAGVNDFLVQRPTGAPAKSGVQTAGGSGLGFVL